MMKYYFLIRGYEEFHDGDEWIGIYTDTAKLKTAYEQTCREIEDEYQKYHLERKGHMREKAIISIYDDADEKWKYDVNLQEIE